MFQDNLRMKYLGAILALMPILFANRVAYGENKDVIQRENEILSLSEKNNPKLIEALEKTKHLAVNEAISIYANLTNYYLGEGGGELLSEKITKLGDKIVPFLIKEKNIPAKCLDKYKKMCLKNDEKIRNISEMLDAIKKGNVLYSQYPTSLKADVRMRMTIVEIFLEDYKRSFGKFPPDLAVLREYAWKEYGYKLKIYNPWGQKLVYNPTENSEKYFIGPGSDIQ